MDQWHEPIESAPAMVEPESPMIAQALKPQGNIVLSIIGAAGGAAIGAVIWAMIEYYASMQIGYIAILVGVLAGGGAVLLGRQRSPLVGVVAALAGAVGIVGGNYASFRISLTSDELRSEFHRVYYQEMKSANPQKWSQMSRDEKEASFKDWYDNVLIPNISYFEVMKNDLKELIWMSFFAALGLYMGYRVGSGKKSKHQQA